MPLDPQTQATRTPGPPSWMAPVKPVVPDHELIRPIGAGSYGDVWLARTTVGTWRAVKVVFRDRFTDPRPYEREFNGIQKFEPLSRGNEAFVDLLQIGRNDADGYFYYIMELADDAATAVESDQSSVISSQSVGQPLNTDHCSLNTGFNPASYVPQTLSKVLLQRGRLPVSECLELGLTLNLGLAHLHRAGLIHRDIKPSNIIFVGGVPKLADIGLVIEVAEARSFVGTEGFIPPEGPTSPQSDLFSMGKVLYEAGMGKDRKDFPEPFTQIIEVPESEQLLEFNAILLKACAASTTERYQSAEEMNADLALLQSGGSVRRQRKLAGKLRFVQRAGALVTALAAVIAVGWWWQARQTKVVSQLAEENRVIAEERTVLAGQRDAVARENHRRLLQVQTANGLRAMEENDPATAALWFTELLRLADGDTDLERRQRERLGTLFLQLPRPVAVMRMQTKASTVRMTPDGAELIGVGHVTNGTAGIGEIVIWGATSQRLLRSLIVTNVSEAPVVSPTGKWAAVRIDGQTRIWDVEAGASVAPAMETQGAVFSPNAGKVALLRGDGKEVHLLALPSGRPLTPPLMHTEKVAFMGFDPTGRWLVTGTRRVADPTDVTEVGQARVWSVLTGEPLSEWIKTEDPVNAAAFSPDGRAAVIFCRSEERRSSGQSPRQAVMLELPSGKSHFALPMFPNWLTDAVFSPDSRYLAVGDMEHKVYLIQAASGEVLHQMQWHGAHHYHLQFSPDGSWLTAAGEGGARIWDVRTGKIFGSPLALRNLASGLEFLPDGSAVTFLNSQGLIEIRDLKWLDPGSETFLPPTVGPIGSALLSPDGSRLATRTVLGELSVWDLRPPGSAPKAMSPDLNWNVRGIASRNQAAWSPDGRLVAAATQDGRVSLWEPATGRELRLTPGHPQPVPHLEFSKDGRRLATASHDGTARVWDVGTGQPVTRPLQHEAAVTHARFSPDGQQLLTGSEDGICRMWNADSGDSLPVRIQRGGRINDVAFSPDGKRVAVGAGMGVTTIHDALSGQQLGEPIRLGAEVEGLWFSPDGQRLLTGSGRGAARIWNAWTGQPTSPLLVHEDSVSLGAFSPDGSRVITGSRDGTARVWDVATGEPLGLPLRHIQYVVSVGFSPDGRRAVTASRAGKARIWELPFLDWSLDEIIAATRVLTGGSIENSQPETVASAEQLEHAWTKLAVRVQNLTNSLESDTWLWHRRRMNLAEQSRDWFAAEFHARQLVRLQPDNSEARAGLAGVLDARPQPRDAGVPAGLIDLSPYYNASLTRRWHPGVVDSHLGELPRGRQNLGGTEFDVRGIIQLSGAATPIRGEYSYPSRITIRIGQKIGRLHFLHASKGYPELESGTQIGHYLVRYANGRQEAVPVRYNEEVSDWYEDESRPKELPNATVAWRGANPASRRGSGAIHLYKWTWLNPTPATEVIAIDFVAEDHRTHPFLVALTAE